MNKLALLGIAFLSSVVVASAASFYPTRLEDSKAVYVAPPDGARDDTAAIQAAIDKVQETTGWGIAFVPSGRYRITRTIYVWPGIRVIGYGATRPVFVLPDNTPGFQEGIGDMFFFTGARPVAGRAFHPLTPPGTVPENLTIADANPGTFYSAMSNVDFEIGNGNAAAVAVRFHAAQHAYLAHIDFHIGSGLAGIHDVGNEGEDLHFYGGRYGILTKKPSPAWQYTLLDSTFEGQREAAIRENEAGLTLVHDEFKNVPTAVAIDVGYSDELWMKNVRFENVSGPAVVISNENSRMTEINAEDIICSHTPVFARFRESGKQIAGTGETYQVKTFSYGLTLAGLGAPGEMKTSFVATHLSSVPPFGPNAIADLPPMNEWVNLRSLGVKGDGVTDDTAAIRNAIAGHRVLYVPSGHYLVTDTITLRPDTVLIGLHPHETQFDIPEQTPAFQGPGSPKPLLEAPQGGKNIVVGIGLYTGGINSRAVGALWMAGKDSLMDDVRFLGGHGSHTNPYNNTHTADPDLHKRWDGQYASLWVTNGGGGTFANIWTPDTFAQAGFYVSNTTTPGYVYELSAEHHVRTEMKFSQVSNWELYALQTEGEAGESAFAQSLEIDRCSNLTIANYHGYRVVRSYQPFPYAIRIFDSHDIRFRNVHVDNNSSIGLRDAKGNWRQHVRSGKVSFDDTIVDPTLHAVVRDREFAWLDVPGKVVRPDTLQVQKLSTGFFNISGGTVDASGDLYFVDAHWQRIYKWSTETKQLRVIRDNPLDPVNLIFDKAGNLIVVSSGGRDETVYSFRPDAPEDQITLLPREEAAERAGMAAVFPTSYWVNGDFSNTLSTKTYEYPTLDQMFRKVMTTRKLYQYVSPDHSLYIPADEVIVQGEPYFGAKFSYILQAYGLVKAAPGQTVYVTNESEQKTYKARVNTDGTLSDLQLFANQGGENIAQDAAGNVYLAVGNIFVYSPAGKLIRTIYTPERPNQLVFGGRDHRTLFIFSRTALYSTRIPPPA
jgi:sugar lactone lactonase YvrE